MPNGGHCHRGATRQQFIWRYSAFATRSPCGCLNPDSCAKRHALHQQKTINSPWPTLVKLYHDAEENVRAEIDNVADNGGSSARALIQKSIATVIATDNECYVKYSLFSDEDVVDLLRPVIVQPEDVQGSQRISHFAPGSSQPLMFVVCLGVKHSN